MLLLFQITPTYIVLHINAVTSTERTALDHQPPALCVLGLSPVGQSWIIYLSRMFQMIGPHLETLLPVRAVRVLREDPGRHAGPGLLLQRWLKTADSALQGSSKGRSKVDQEAAKEKSLNGRKKAHVLFKLKVNSYALTPLKAALTMGFYGKVQFCMRLKGWIVGSLFHLWTGWSNSPRLQESVWKVGVVPQKNLSGAAKLQHQAD